VTSGRTPVRAEVEHFVHFLLAQLRWQHGKLIGSFDEFDEEAARHNRRVRDETSVDDCDVKAMGELMDTFFSRHARGDRWIPFFPVLGEHELYIMTHIWSLNGLNAKKKYALSCAFSGSRWAPLFEEAIMCLFDGKKELCDEAKLMFEDPQKAFRRGGGIHERFLAYRARGGKLHTTCFSPRPVPRGAKGDEYTFYILERTRTFFTMGLEIFDRLGTLKRTGGFEAVDVEMQRTKWIGPTLSKMFLVSTHFGLPDLHLLDEGIEVGIGAQESFKILYPGIQAKKDYKMLPDRRDILVSLLSHVHDLVSSPSSIEPRLIPMIKWCAQRAKQKYRNSIPSECFEDHLGVLVFQVALCEWRKFRNNVDKRRKAGRGMSV